MNQLPLAVLECLANLSDLVDQQHQPVQMHQQLPSLHWSQCHQWTLLLPSDLVDQLSPLVRTSLMRLVNLVNQKIQFRHAVPQALQVLLHLLGQAVRYYQWHLYILLHLLLR